MFFLIKSIIVKTFEFVHKKYYDLVKFLIRLFIQKKK